MIARLAGVAVDARLVARRSERRDRDSAARWVVASLAAALRAPIPARVPWSWRLVLRLAGVDRETARRLAA